MTTLDVQAEGLPVRRLWRGDYQALFVELGELTASTKTRRDGSLMNPVGEVSIRLYGEWRIESSQQVLCEGSSEPALAAPVLEGLVGRKVVALGVVGSLPEIEVVLTDGLRLVSVSSNGGEPDWSVADRRCSPPRWFDVRDGVVTATDGGPSG